MIAIGFDTETWPFAPGRQAPRLVCGQFYSHQNGAIVAARDDAARRFREIVTSLESHDLELVGLNIAFDLAVMANHDLTLMAPIVAALRAGRVWDVGIFERHRAVALGHLKSDPELRGAPPTFSLAELEKKYLETDRTALKKGPDTWRRRYHELDGIPVAEWPPEAVSYCEDDARNPVLIRDLQLERDGLPPLFRESVRHAFSYELARCRGWRTDGAAVADLEARLRQSVRESMPVLLAAGIVRPDGSENQTETKRRVHAVAGPGARLTRTGKKLERAGELPDPGTDAWLKYVATDADTLEECRGQDPALDAWTDVKVDRSELSTFIPKLRLGTQYPISPRWNLIVSSYRCSASQPNVQQQPRRSGVRECFVPRPGYVYSSTDFHVAELCSLAQLCLDLFGASELATVINAGRDPHLVFAADLAGVSYEVAAERYAARDKRIKELRQAAKAANFGIPGGLGKRALRSFARGYGVELTESEAGDLRESWLDRFPEMRLYFRWISQQCGALGSFTHHHPRTGFIRGDVGYTDGCNHGFQHLTAVGCKEAMADVQERCFLGARGQLWSSWPELEAAIKAGEEDPLVGSYVIGMIHDELICEHPRSVAPEAADRVAELMVAAMNRWTPDVPASADAALMPRWFKDAEPVRDGAGRLMLWTPEGAVSV